MRAGTGPLRAIILLYLALSCCADRSWDFSDVRSKQEAKARAQTAFAGIDWSGDAPPAHGKIKDMFEDWATEQGMTFTSVQAKQKALKNFRDNLKAVRDVNLDDTATWWASGNAFSHLSEAEFAATHLMDPASAEVTEPVATWTPPADALQRNRKLQQSGTGTVVDWVARGKVTTIKNQGSCGSCWAFAATSAIESLYLIKYGGNASRLSLSEQQLVSCIYADGCQGGSSYTAMNYVYNKNQTTTANYPYVSGTTRVGGSCNSTILGGLQSGKYVRLAAAPKSVSPSRNESTLMAAVTVQPTVIYFNATRSWSIYAGGLYNASAAGCWSTGINHAMVAVGFDTTNSSAKHWVIRNSWGKWGIQGYAKVLMTGDGDGPCGLYRYGYVPSTTGFTTTSSITGL